RLGSRTTRNRPDRGLAERNKGWPGPGVCRSGTRNCRFESRACRRFQYGEVIGVRPVPHQTARRRIQYLYRTPPPDQDRDSQMEKRVLIARWLGSDVQPVPIYDEASVSSARQLVRQTGQQLNLKKELVENVALLSSELTHNQLAHSKQGYFAVRPIERH